MRRVLVGLGLTLVVVLVLVVTVFRTDDKALDPEVLPDARLTELAGDATVQVDELEGPMVVTLFASWCGPCEQEMPVFQEFYEKHGEQVDVLGINWGDQQEEAALRLVERSGVTFDVLQDLEDKTGAPPNVPIRYLPTLWLVDGEGDVTYRRPIEIKSLGDLEQLVEDYLDVSL